MPHLKSSLSLLILLLLPACSSVDWSPQHEPPFSATPIAPDRFRVEVNLPEIAPAPASMFVLCACAQLAIDHQKSYYYIEDRAPLDRGRGHFTVLLEDLPPEGAPVLDFQAPDETSPEDQLEFAHVAAGPALTACKTLGLDAYSTDP